MNISKRQTRGSNTPEQRRTRSRASEYSPFYTTGNNKYTKGKEFMLENGEEYIGEYHVVEGGGAFVGPAPKTTVRPIRLRSYYTVHDQFIYDRLHKFQVPVKLNSQPQPYIYIPNESEGVYVNGYDYRYFVQKRNSDTFAIEINSVQYERIGKTAGIDGGLYAAAAIRWRLTGTLEFIERTNKTNVNVASAELPALPFSITSYTQFARPTAQDYENNEDVDLLKPRHKNQITLIKKTYDPITKRIIP